MKLAHGLATSVVSFPLCFLSSILAQAQDLKFEARQLAIDANEGIAAADVNSDGKLDIVAGRFWYQNGDWAPRPLRQIDDWSGYVQSNGDYVFDVNADGRPDVVAGSFLPTEIHWYENPGDRGLRLGQLWRRHLLLETGQTNNEGGLLQDLDGDGNLELVVDRWVKNVPMLVYRFVEKSASELAQQSDAASTQTNPKTVHGEPAKYKLVTAKIGDRGNGHGLAIGDLNGDGRQDILVGQGWYEQPDTSPWSQRWKFHSAWDLHASLPMLVVDLNRDGKNDLIHGKGHDFGLYWWENLGLDKSGTPEWKEHLIDREYSQPHTLAWADLTGDGNPELITGKRYYAHNGGDPGGEDMPGMYYYTWNRDALSFQRHVIEEGHVGTGLQIVVEDFDADGDADLAVAGKSGTYLLTNQGVK